MTDPARDDVFEVSLNELKIREIEEIEKMLGASLDSAFAVGAPRGKALRVVACVVKRRTDPSFSMEQAGEMVITLDEGGVDPTSGSAS